MTVMLLMRHVLVNSRMGSWCSVYHRSLSYKQPIGVLQHLLYRIRLGGFVDCTYGPTFLYVGEYTLDAAGDISNYRLWSRRGTNYFFALLSGFYLRYSTAVVRPTSKSGTMSPNSLATFRIASRSGLRRWGTRRTEETGIGAGEVREIPDRC